MRNNVVVSERLVKKIAVYWLALQRQGKRKEAEDYINRLNPTAAFYRLLKQQMKKEIME